jgi:tetratricopeptide (TPR) repeat protein
MEIMMRCTRQVTVIIVSIAAITSAAAKPAPNEYKFVIGNPSPLADQCYRNAYSQLDSYQALEPCNASIETETLTNRRRAAAHVNRGVIYFNIGDYERAAADFTTAIDLNINVKAKTYSNRGLSYEAMGVDNLAKADYQAALAFRPEYEFAKHRLEELEKPPYERQGVPKKITVEAPAPPALTI